MARNAWNWRGLWATGGVVLLIGCGSTTAPQPAPKTPPVDLVAASPSPAGPESSVAGKTPSRQTRRFVVGLAPLRGDEKDEMRRFIRDELRKTDRELRVVEVEMAPKAEDREDLTTEEGRNEIKRALAASRADILIWGEVIRVEGDSLPRLFIATANAGPEVGQGIATERYECFVRCNSENVPPCAAPQQAHHEPDRLNGPSGFNHHIRTVGKYFVNGRLGVHSCRVNDMSGPKTLRGFERLITQIYSDESPRTRRLGHHQAEDSDPSCADDHHVVPDFHGRVLNQALPGAT